MLDDLHVLPVLRRLLGPVSSPAAAKDGRHAEMISGRALRSLLRDGNLRGRVQATRGGQAAIRLQLVTAALGIGLLDALADGGADTAELARRTGSSDVALLQAFLRVVFAAGLIAARDGEVWQLTRRGRAVVDDDLVRASYEAFGDFHTGLYRRLGPVLRGGPRRRDVSEKAG